MKVGEIIEGYETKEGTEKVEISFSVPSKYRDSYSSLLNNLKITVFTLLSNMTHITNLFPLKQTGKKRLVEHNHRAVITYI